jgi:hypothetical protein
MNSMTGFMELGSLIGGAVTGFIFKYMSQIAQDRKEQFEMLIRSIKTADESADAAAKRVPNDKAGNWIRRIIVLTILFGVITAPFILALLDRSIMVETVTPVRHFLGLEWGGNTKFYQLSSYLISPEIRWSLLSIMGFYFGSGAAKR